MLLLVTLVIVSVPNGFGVLTFLLPPGYENADVDLVDSVMIDNAIYWVGWIVETKNGTTSSTPAAGTFLMAQKRVKDFRLLGKSVVAPNAPRGFPAPAFSLPFAVPADASGAALALSRDTQTIVGYYDSGFFTPYHAFRWTESSDVVDLGTLDPANNAARSSFATDVSSDGSVIVGYSETAGGATVHAFRWTAAGDMEDLGSGAGAGGTSRAFAVSADGSVIVGESDFPGGFGTVRQAFRWTEAGGFQKLGALQTDYPSVATAMTADGSVIVGVSGIEVTQGTSSINGSRAFRWTETGGMQDLSGGLGNVTSAATGVSDDGAIVVGIYDPESDVGSFFPSGPRLVYGTGNRAFQWTESAGSADLNQLLTAAGTDLAGATMVAAHGISSDGTWIAGAAISPTTEPDTSVAVFASLTYTPPPETSRLLNLSTRGLSQNGDNVLIPGFVISGTANKQLLIRAVGPTLNAPPINLPGATIPDPTMTLQRLDFSTNPAHYEVVTANDDWGANANASEITTTAAAAGAFAFQSATESALLLDLAPGQYTVIAGDAHDTSGIAIVELYDADPSAVDSRLVNISNRGFCGVGDQVMIPGFVVSSESQRTLLIRVVGPTLSGAPFNVPGTMADPKLEIFPAGSGTPILTQENWGDNPDAAHTAQVASDLGAFALANGSADAAFVVTLAPRSYTVVGSASDGTSTGVVLVEVYVVP